MLTGPVIGFLVAASFATWVYTKIARRSGGNVQTSLVVAGIAGLFAFFITVAVLSMIDNTLGN
jgi:hypothetical protein